MVDEKLVPKLRFEFSSSWESKKLKDIIQISKEKYNPDSDKTNYKCIELEHLAQETGLLLGYTDSINQNSIKNKFHEDNILFGKLRPYLKKFYYTNFVGVCSSEIWVFNTNEYSKYIYYLIQTKKFLDISNVSAGSKMPRSDWNFMKNFVFSIPDIKTQKEIANLFSMIDNKIELLEKKYQQYQNFKKYLMQQIFTQKLRFDFKNDWEEYRLGDIGETYNGLSGLSKKNFEKGNSRYITYKSIFDNNVLIEDLTGPVDLTNKSQNNVEKGDLFFTGSSETPEDVGMVSVLDFDIENCYLNSFCFGYRLKDLTKINPIFLAYYLRSPIMRNKIQILAQGSTRFNLSKKEILKLKISIPNTKEQIKILNLMQNNDKLLKNTACQITEMNLFKKSLLQQMFI